MQGNVAAAKASVSNAIKALAADPSLESPAWVSVSELIIVNAVVALVLSVLVLVLVMGAADHGGERLCGRIAMHGHDAPTSLVRSFDRSGCCLCFSLVLHVCSACLPTGLLALPTMN